MNPINTGCYSADFVASENMGWNYNSGGTLWKDWTPVAINLTPLHGQTIHVKLTTYDCNHDGHFGYASVSSIDGTARTPPTPPSPHRGPSR